MSTMRSTSSTPAATSRSSSRRSRSRCLPVSDHQTLYASGLVERLRAAGVRAEIDARNETLNYRVRAAETQKVPYVLVVGEREQESGSVSVRRRHVSGQTVLPFDRFQMNIQEEIKTRGIFVDAVGAT